MVPSISYTGANDLLNMDDKEFKQFLQPNPAQKAPEELEFETEEKKTVKEVRKNNNQTQAARATKTGKVSSKKTTKKEEAQTAANPNLAAPKPSKSSDAFYQKNKGGNFGIVIGTYMAVELQKAVTSVQYGDIDLTLIEDVQGKRAILPAQTTIFARKSLNKQNEKLELLAYKGITPDGEEFNLRATAYAMDETAGLYGVITDNTASAAKKEVGKAAIEATTDAASAALLATGNPAGLIGAAGLAGAGRQATRNLPQTEPIYITTQPQVFYLRVERTF